MTFTWWYSNAWACADAWWCFVWFAVSYHAVCFCSIVSLSQVSLLAAILKAARHVVCLFGLSRHVRGLSGAASWCSSICRCCNLQRAMQHLNWSWCQTGHNATIRIYHPRVAELSFEIMDVVAIPRLSLSKGIQSADMGHSLFAASSHKLLFFV